MWSSGYAREETAPFPEAQHLSGYVCIHSHLLTAMWENWDFNSLQVGKQFKLVTWAYHLWERWGLADSDLPYPYAK